MLRRQFAHRCHRGRTPFSSIRSCSAEKPGRVSIGSAPDTPGSENSSEAYAFQRQEALARLEAGETQADVARSYGVDATTIGRLQ